MKDWIGWVAVAVIVVGGHVAFAGADTTVTGRIHCTGSMEPALTCRDEVTLETAFDPDAVKVGDIIAYPTLPGCGKAPKQIHRVVAVKVEDGRHYYSTKGDANTRPDGCWQPAADVAGVVVEIHRAVANTR